MATEIFILLWCECQKVSYTKTTSAYDPAIPLLGIDPREMKTCLHETNVPNSCVHDSKKIGNSSGNYKKRE